jgi:2-oxoisovalerate dehydrogenase E2 component (dihydrolipoyl transacylase)
LPRVAASSESPSASTSGLLDAPAQDGPRFYTPVVMRMAREHGIDLAQLQGSGLGGRVTKRDLERYIEQQGSAQPAAETSLVAAPAAERPAASVAPAPPQPAATPTPSAPSSATDDEHLPVSPIRRAIADHMVRSLQTSPHAWSMVEVDMTEIGRLRSLLQSEWSAREGFELTYLPFVLKAVAEALREHRTLNATWAEDHVVLKRRINLGIAVATEDALIVPVLKDADQLSLVGLARALRGLVQKARAGKLSVEEVRGGTFTVNNTGSLGSILSQPIINQPQAAILTTEAIVKRAVVLAGDAIAVRAMMNLCCSFDHRVLDGAQALRFLGAVKRRLESYSSESAIL